MKVWTLGYIQAIGNKTLSLENCLYIKGVSGNSVSFGSIEFHGCNLPFSMKEEKCPLQEFDKSSSVIKTINRQPTVFGHFLNSTLRPPHNFLGCLSSWCTEDPYMNQVSIAMISVSTKFFIVNCNILSRNLSLAENFYYNKYIQV